MTVEEAYALATLIAAGAGVLLAAGSFGLRGILSLLAFAGLVWLAMLYADRKGSSDTATNIMVTAVIGGIGLAHLRLGWLARRRWSVARGLLALAALAGLVGLGFLLLSLFPSGGFLPNFGYVIGIYGLALPAAAGFALGLTAAALIRRADSPRLMRDA